MKTIRVFLCAILLLTILTLSAFASQGVVKRASNLRPDPSSAQKPIGKLQPSDEVEVLDSEPTNGYYHVRTDDGKEGWIWGKALRVVDEEQKLAFSGTLSGQPADSISDQWDKPTPAKTALLGVEGSCPWNGDGSDPGTFVLKNRSDVSTSYHDVKWAAIHDLAFPKDTTLRKNWSPGNISEIQRYEGVPIRTVGYIVAVKPQANGSGEGTNCHFNKSADTDVHIALVGEQGDAERNSVVIEITPRLLKAHPKWNKSTLAPYLNTDSPVRISGWLMLDPDHRNHLNKYRYTLWEIHPITMIEVMEDGQWKPIDQ
jgi:hypothetical protein